jgi:long-chain acyl-CoA synthetase
MADTLCGIFLETVDRHRKPVQFIRRNAVGWENVSADHALADVESLALGLREMGVQPGDRVALLSENRYEWPITDLAVLGLGAVMVPIYPTLTAPQVRHILADSGAKVVVVSTPAQLDKIESLRPNLPDIAAVIAMEPAPPPAPGERSWDTVRARGAELRARNPTAYRDAAKGVRASDLATIIYTSGTTGDPKGAMLTHGNIAFDVNACLEVIALGPDDIALSFLPLCHIFERMAGLYAMLCAGAAIAYAQSIDTVAADAQQVKPTVLCGVPRFFEKVFARVMENAFHLPPIRKVIFHWGLRTGREVAKLHFERRRPAGLLAFKARIADRLVGAKVRSRVGGRLRFCISGGAPLNPKVMEFFFAVGIPVIEGYGLTETSPVICVNRVGAEKPGSVGPPIPGVEVKIGAEGEILTRGPHVMKGYFRNDAATRAAIRDGWFHTGDVGHLDAEGYLVITDRLKDLLVTAGGKKVAPQPHEGRLKTSRWIAEAVLLGDRRPYVVALIVPNFANLETYAKNHGWRFEGKEDLIRQPQAIAMYQREVDALNEGLAPFETVKRFALLPRELSQEAGELTPTLKVRRRVITEKFAELIESLYASASPSEAG